MTVGLLAKTALFPLHLWLPPAHAGAPAAASAVLSTLVVKGSWFLVVRLWFHVMPGVVTLPANSSRGIGTAAIVVGSVVYFGTGLWRVSSLPIRRWPDRLPVSHVPCSPSMPPATGWDTWSATLTGGLLQVMSHATAKAGMFMAAGLILMRRSVTDIADLMGVRRACPSPCWRLRWPALRSWVSRASGAYHGEEG